MLARHSTGQGRYLWGRMKTKIGKLLCYGMWLASWIAATQAQGQALDGNWNGMLEYENAAGDTVSYIWSVYLVVDKGGSALSGYTQWSEVRHGRHTMTERRSLAGYYQGDLVFFREDATLRHTGRPLETPFIAAQLRLVWDQGALCLIGTYRTRQQDGTMSAPHRIKVCNLIPVA